jgi:hypothetical protein
MPQARSRASAAPMASAEAAADRSLWSLLHFRGTKVGLMPAKAGIHLSAAPLYDAGFPLSRE